MATAPAVAPRDQYLTRHTQYQATAGGADWLQVLRRRGRESFATLGFPTARRGNEAWKYTSVAPIAEASLLPAPLAPAARPGRDLITPHLLSRSWTRLVFVNGRYASALSSANGLPSGVTVGDLSISDGPVLKRHLGNLVPAETDGFAALNTAYVGHGAFVHLARGAVVERPIHLLFVTSGGALAAFPRVLVVAERGSMAKIVETYAGPAGSSYFSDVVGEYFLEEGAALDHTKLLLEGDQAFHIATSGVHQAASSTYTSASVATGGALARNTVSIVLDGEGAACTLNGLYRTAGEQHVDNSLFIDHAKPHTKSDEYFKGLVGGRSRAVFGGRVLVRKDSQKVEAHQYDKNLLLSPGAEIDSKPQLEIYADDVKCTHGATAGQLSENDLFYLRSRGIDESRARELLAHAFAAELLDRISLAPVRRKVEELLLRDLPSFEPPAAVRGRL